MTTRIISSRTADELASLILEYDEKGVIELPGRLTPDTNYDQGLSRNFRQEDIAFVKNALYKSNLTSEEMSALDAILRWNFRNAGTMVRAVYGLIAAALFPLLVNTEYRDQTINASSTSLDLPISFAKESMWAIRRITKMTVATGAHECKIPRNTMSVEYDELSDMGLLFGTDIYDVEVDMMRNLLKDMTSTSPVDKTRSKTEVARKLCIQMTMAISEYRQDDTFGRLRGFLNNVCHFANILRIVTTDKNEALNRLCTDVLDQVHSTDRLLNSNCVAAQALMERMKRGSLVYGEILELGRHQHRVMAIEVASCIGLFSYLLKESAHLVSENGDVYKTLARLLKFSGIATRYNSEIMNKMA